mmetsp:Transcript_112578/g.257863  ORF Transcript_112578/g.257863 Transcript_112578/m.257863 type:complete len:224 (-) Transcript_112578:182-853(-)
MSGFLRRTGPLGAARCRATTCASFPSTGATGSLPHRSQNLRYRCQFPSPEGSCGRRGRPPNRPTTGAKNPSRSVRGPPRPFCRSRRAGPAPRPASRPTTGARSLSRRERACQRGWTASGASPTHSTRCASTLEKQGCWSTLPLPRPPRRSPQAAPPRGRPRPPTTRASSPSTPARQTPCPHPLLPNRTPEWTRHLSLANQARKSAEPPCLGGSGDPGQRLQWE